MAPSGTVPGNARVILGASRPCNCKNSIHRVFQYWGMVNRWFGSHDWSAIHSILSSRYVKHKAPQDF